MGDDAVETRIIRVGAEGDGVGALADGTSVYVPLSLPGELVRLGALTRRGGGRTSDSVSILEESPDRDPAPPCAHFGDCGGCALQHWRLPAYEDWKIGLLRAALTRAGYDDAEIAPLVSSPPRSRRRMDLALRRVPNAVEVGLHRRQSSTIVDLTECHVLHPDLFALVAPLRDLLARSSLVRREGSIIVNLLDSGPDILLRTDIADPSPADRRAMIAFAIGLGIPRISWVGGTETPEPICMPRPPVTTMSGVTVNPPPGTFLQATRDGEAAILAAVVAGLPEKRTARSRVAELYAGCGTITFALAAQARVTAWEGDAAAIAALRTAANHAGLAGRVEAFHRDLVRQPLSAKDLSGFAAAVLDPPHAGAAMLMDPIAAAKVPVVIYVSCNPAALSRDAAVLRGAGYRLTAVTPIDQFVWSPRLESVSVFVR